MAKINIDKLDDIQLAMYLAQKNNKGQTTGVIKKEAESILEWIRCMRNQSKKKQETTIKPITMEQCKCCEREKELRLGYCFDCANAESVIVEGMDMYDNEITKEEGMPMSMSKLKWVLKKFNVIKNK